MTLPKSERSILIRGHGWGNHLRSAAGGESHTLIV